MLVCSIVGDYYSIEYNAKKNSGGWYVPAPGAKIPKAKKEKQMLEYDSKLIKSKQPFGFD